MFDGAVGDAHWGAAGSAAGLKAKLLGFMREKIEIGGVGDFDQCNTIDEIAAKTLDDMPLDVALETHDELRNALLRVAADRALPVAGKAAALLPARGRFPV